MPQDKHPSTTGSVDEWFARHEEELLRQARRERKRRTEEDQASADKEKRDAHFMKCPKCGDSLEAVQMDGVEIDRCKQCEGVFLDRGELEEIMLKRSDERKSIFRKLLGFGSD